MEQEGSDKKETQSESQTQQTPIIKSNSKHRSKKENPGCLTRIFGGIIGLVVGAVMGFILSVILYWIVDFGFMGGVILCGLSSFAMSLFGFFFPSYHFFDSSLEFLFDIFGK